MTGSSVTMGNKRSVPPIIARIALLAFTIAMKIMMAIGYVMLWFQRRGR